jgi:hypothetical protein
MKQTNLNKWPKESKQSCLGEDHVELRSCVGLGELGDHLLLLYNKMVQI